MSLHLSLEQFEGPLDLLCHLIDRNEIDIYDIPIALVTGQYMAAIYEMDTINLELASEFIVMGATLLEIKSRMLLPAKDDDGTDSQWEDPRTELVERIVEYRRYKEAAVHLQSREEMVGMRFFKEPEDLDVLLDKSSGSLKDLRFEADILVEALRRVIDKMDRIDTNRETYFKTMRKDPYTVEEKMTWIKTRLAGGKTSSFMGLFDNASNRLEVITTFLALLELMRGGHVKVWQEERTCDPLITGVDREHYE